MILTGPKIAQEHRRGKITIDPFDERFINPNSYDFRLGSTILVYQDQELDTRAANPTTELVIPDDGLVLRPDKLYLGHSVESFGSDHYVPILRGKSSTGRMGLFVHITADLIDIGSHGQLTLMLHAVQPLRVYPGMRIGQITFWQPDGDIQLYNGKYQRAVGPLPSQSFRDFT